MIKWVAFVLAVCAVVSIQQLQRRVEMLESKVCIQGTVGCMPLEPGWVKR
jgi:hypothetical protein